MKIPASIKQTTGVEASPVGLAHLITAGRGAGSEGTLALLSHLASGREPRLRGGRGKG
jgi:hypothetical protein